MSCNYFCKYPKGRDIVLSFILIKKNKGNRNPLGQRLPVPQDAPSEGV